METNVCRFCFATSHLLNLFSNDVAARGCTIYEVVSDILSDKIEKIEGTHNKICIMCHCRLANFYEYKMQCLDFNIKFEEIAQKALNKKKLEYEYLQRQDIHPSVKKLIKIYPQITMPGKALTRNWRCYVKLTSLLSEHLKTLNALNKTAKSQRSSSKTKSNKTCSLNETRGASKTRENSKLRQPIVTEHMSSLSTKSKDENNDCVSHLTDDNISGTVLEQIDEDAIPLTSTGTFDSSLELADATNKGTIKTLKRLADESNENPVNKKIKTLHDEAEESTEEVKEIVNKSPSSDNIQPLNENSVPLKHSSVFDEILIKPLFDENEAVIEYPFQNVTVLSDGEAEVTEKRDNINVEKVLVRDTNNTQTNNDLSECAVKNIEEKIMLFFQCDKCHRKFTDSSTCGRHRVLCHQRTAYQPIILLEKLNIAPVHCGEPLSTLKLCSSQKYILALYGSSHKVTRIRIQNPINAAYLSREDKIETNIVPKTRNDLLKEKVVNDITTFFMPQQSCSAGLKSSEQISGNVEVSNNTKKVQAITYIPPTLNSQLVKAVTPLPINSDSSEAQHDTKLDHIASIPSSLNGLKILPVAEYNNIPSTSKGYHSDNLQTLEIGLSSITCEQNLLEVETRNDILSTQMPGSISTGQRQKEHVITSGRSKKKSKPTFKEQNSTKRQSSKKHPKIDIQQLESQIAAQYFAAFRKSVEIYLNAEIPRNSLDEIVGIGLAEFAHQAADESLLKEIIKYHHMPVVTQFSTYGTSIRDSSSNNKRCLKWDETVTIDGIFSDVTTAKPMNNRLQLRIPIIVFPKKGNDKKATYSNIVENVVPQEQQKLMVSSIRTDVPCLLSAIPNKNTSAKPTSVVGKLIGINNTAKSFDPGQFSVSYSTNKAKNVKLTILSPNSHQPVASNLTFKQQRIIKNPRSILPKQQSLLQNQINNNDSMTMPTTPISNQVRAGVISNMEEVRNGQLKSQIIVSQPNHVQSSPEIFKPINISNSAHMLLSPNNQTLEQGSSSIYQPGVSSSQSDKFVIPNSSKDHRGNQFSFKPISVSRLRTLKPKLPPQNSKSFQDLNQRTAEELATLGLSMNNNIDTISHSSNILTSGGSVQISSVVSLADMDNDNDCAIIENDDSAIIEIEDDVEIKGTEQNSLKGVSPKKLVILTPNRINCKMSSKKV